jgi:hypothetical protein
MNLYTLLYSSALGWVDPCTSPLVPVSLFEKETGQVGVTCVTERATHLIGRDLASEPNCDMSELIGRLVVYIITAVQAGYEDARPYLERHPNVFPRSRSPPSPHR